MYLAMAVDPTLVALGQAKPPLQVEIVSDLLKLGSAHEEAGEKADHDLGHVPVNRIRDTLEALNQVFESLPACLVVVPFGFEGRGNLTDFLDVFLDRLLFGSDMFQPAVDAPGKTAELGFRDPPFFSSKFRWIESLTSARASAIHRPGG